MIENIEQQEIQDWGISHNQQVRNNSMDCTSNNSNFAESLVEDLE